MYKGVIGTFGIDNRNMKGRRLLNFFIQNRLRVTNSYFKKPSFVTWRSFNASKYPHLPDVITTSYSFFKHVRDCGVTSTGMWSDHSAVRLTFSDRSFKFNSTYVERSVIDWKCIQNCEETNQMFNVNLQRKLKNNMRYTLFNEAILNSAQQSAMTNRQSNKGLFHHIKSTLTPLLAARSAILHSIRSDQHTPPQETILNIKTLQQEVDEVIEIRESQMVKTSS